MDFRIDMDLGIVNCRFQEPESSSGFLIRSGNSCVILPRPISISSFNVFKTGPRMS